MRIQVEARSIGDADALQPPVRREDLSVPAIGRIVGHLSGKMLPEAQLLLVHPRKDEECLSPDHEVRQGLVVDDALGHSITHLPPCRIFRRKLLLGVEERERHIRNRCELRVRLALRIDEVLDLSLSELALPGQASAGSDLVSEGSSDLRNAERKAVRVLLAAVLVVQEDALGRLRPQIALQVATWPNWRREHQVELIRLAQIVPRVR
mmetsp:Transcript_21214/g.46792  ORF Transcript_21214/g.46792 Transcript_21214/m.46792 type:complete len:208 (-) Transcript_21214:580-1203(-)